MEGRTQKATRNITFGMASKVIAIFLEFISRYFFINYLGEELLGVNGVFTNIIQVLSLAELGMNNVLNFSFYEPLAKGDYNKIVGLVCFYRKIYNIIASIVLMIGLILTPLLKFIIKTDINIPNLFVIYYIFLLDTVFSYLFVYKYTIINADQKNYIYSKYEIIKNIIGCSLQIVTLILFKNLVIYLAIKFVMTLAMNVRLVKKAEEDYPYIKMKGDLRKDEQKLIVDTIKSGFIYRLSAVLLNSTDNILISMLAGTIWVGYLYNYITIQTGISSFYTIIFTSIVASIGNLLAIDKSDKSLKVFEGVCVVADWIGIVITVCYFVLSAEFIRLWIGEQYILDNYIVLLKAIMLFISCTMNPIFSYREAMGLYRRTKYSILIAGVINIFLSVWLGIYRGMSGILFASVVSILITYYWYEPMIMYNECFHSSIKWFVLSRIKGWISLMIILFATYEISGLFNVNSWLGWIVKAILVFISCNMICMFIYGRNFKLLYLFENVETRKRKR